MKKEIWNGLLVFAAACEAGSFAAASRQLGTTPSAVSHAVKKLEKQLETRLLHRSTRSIAATEAGLKLLSELAPTLKTLNQTIDSIGEHTNEVSGRIRITCHHIAAKYSLIPRMSDFMQAYPNVFVDLDMNDRLVDFIAEGFDAGIRPSEKLSPDMIAVRIDQPKKLYYVASPTYLANFGTPENPRALNQHRCIGYRFISANTLYPWTFVNSTEEYSVNPKFHLVLNDAELLLQAALNDCGIVCLVEEQVIPWLQNGQLVEVFENSAPTLPANYLYFSGRDLVPTALRAFIDFMKC
ncbi:LysR family transcriptional regulator [Microbulbifer sp. SAOS-129_SWC]|uniref:LysR family transcriptional regulator n=1 Tax=Microbulbifer sp. SAOS-129_SWC TaxID=3145235 RepID=UPI003217DCE8